MVRLEDFAALLRETFFTLSPPCLGEVFISLPFPDSPGGTERPVG